MPHAGVFRDEIEVKHHVYVKRQTPICTTWPSFPFTCLLLLIIYTHKLVVLRNFVSIQLYKLFWAVFISSFSILRNSRLESVYCNFIVTLFDLPQNTNNDKTRQLHTQKQMKVARKPKKKPWGFIGLSQSKNKVNSNSKARIESKIQWR